MRKGLLIATSALLLLCVFAGAGWVYMKTAMHGFSARAEPSKMEAMMAEYARATAMPSSAKNMKNPIVLTPAVQREALAHYADHCAVCHANNGSGQSMFGTGMYAWQYGWHEEGRRDTSTASVRLGSVQHPRCTT